MKKSFFLKTEPLKVKIVLTRGLKIKGTQLAYFNWLKWL